MDYIRFDRDPGGGERLDGALWDFPRDYLLVTVETPADEDFVFRAPPGRRRREEAPGPSESPEVRRARARRRKSWRSLSQRTRHRYIRVLTREEQGFDSIDGRAHPWSYSGRFASLAARRYRAGYGTNIYHRRQPERSLQPAEEMPHGSIGQVVDYPVHFIEQLAERFIDEAVPALGYDQAADRVAAGVGLPPGRASAYARLYIKPS